MAHVYALSLDGKNFRYIGKSCQPAGYRLRSHRRCAVRGIKYPVYDWMRKHGPENVIETVLESSSPDLLAAREVFWIAHYRTLGYSLLNLTDGGTGGVVPLSDDGRRRISESARRHAQDPEWRARISASLKKTLADEDIRARISAERLSRYRDPEYLERHRESARRAAQSTYDSEKRAAAVKKQWDDPVAGEKRRKATLKSLHIRWHVNRGVVKSECEFCVVDRRSDSG